MIEMLKDFPIKLRPYQEEILERCLKRNCLVVLPTGTGKTVIAAALIHIYRKKYPDEAQMFLAPTRPLVRQHCEFFKSLGFPVIEITGSIRKEKRRKLWMHNYVFFATPQTVSNDLDIVRGKKFSVIVFDEAHRAVGKYPYVIIAQALRGSVRRIIALTASPGYSREKIEEIIRNLNIEDIAYISEWDPRIREWIPEKKIKTIFVEFPECYKKIVKMINEVTKGLLTELKDLGYVDTASPYKVKLSDLIKLQESVADREVAKKLAAVIKLLHLRYAIESQGVPAAVKFLQKIREEEKASDRLLMEIGMFRAIYSELMKLHNLKYIHPKVVKLIEIVEDRIKEEKSILVFTQLRDTAKILKEVLEKRGISCSLLLGHADLSEKKQIEEIEKFKKGLSKVLISTSVGEEGLHIPSVDTVIFYEPVPSALRTIQRRGRAGRVKFGEIIVLVSEGQMERGYYWVSRKREKEMYKLLKSIRKDLLKSRKSILEYFRDAP